MQKKLQWRVYLILAVIAGSLWSIFPLNKKINLGLDLQGGMHLVLRVDTSKLSPEAKAKAPERALEVIRNRIDEFGVKEPSIQLEGTENIVVQLPGISDRGRALDLLGKTAHMEFKMVADDPEKLKAAVAGTVPEGFELAYMEAEPLLLEARPALTGDAVVDARVDFDQSAFGQPYVGFNLNAEGGRAFAKVTRENIGKRLAIVLDGKIKSAPRIETEIPSGQGRITGRFSQSEASDLAIVLRVGALPAPIIVEEERTIGPLLGQDSINKGIKAVVIGGLFVIIFMAVYYLLAGVISDIALLINLLMIFSGLSILPMIFPGVSATLTLPGIAGIVLSLGMAVDANVLINERIREELKAGKPMRTAIDNGYHRAWSAIWDSHATSLIAAFLMFQFGTGPIRGFAVTLTIGLIASLFTATLVTYTIMQILLSKGFIKDKLPMLHLIGETKLDFIGKRRIFYVLSTIMIAVSVFAYFHRGKEAYGIDFAGGQLQEYSFKTPPHIDKVREAVKEIGLTDASIQQFNDNPRVVLIRTTEDKNQALTDKLKKTFMDQDVQVLKIERVGPIAGKQLRGKAFLAILWSLGGILVYIAFRFKHFNFALAGVAGLLHDVIVALGFLMITGKQLDLLSITAFLTIAGYSISDAIIIYDRVRENTRIGKKMTFAELINLSVNQTLGRTILTTTATLISVLAILLFGGPVLSAFAAALLIGFTSGVYSTVYISAPLVLFWEGLKNKKLEKARV